ncbi:MAG: metal ABC transporter substrate-binding protein [Acidimicrobiia bacterium]|nr:metal ABC transporter substrate-binding protein [Acidimicrobiia bacterium]
MSIGVVAIVPFVAGACGSTLDDTAVDGSGRPTIVATTSVWADVVANVACDGSVAVETLIPPGADPHAFEPSLADRTMLDGAALVVANGLGLEATFEDTIGAAEATGAPVLRVGEHARPLPTAATDDDTEDDHAGDHRTTDDVRDPHVWLDPTRVADVLPVVADNLVTEAGLDRGTVDGCVEAYRAELQRLDAEVADQIAAIPVGDRELVTNHDSLAYFADRYDFEIVGTVIPSTSTLAATSPAQLDELADRIRSSDVTAIFVETGDQADDAQALATRIGDVQIASLPTADPTVHDGYAGYLRETAAVITSALSQSNR